MTQHSAQHAAPVGQSNVGGESSISLISRSLEDTATFADGLAHVLVPGDVVLLIGDLGAGKTAFTKALARSLSVDEPITSPTFTIMRTYEGALPNSSNQGNSTSAPATGSATSAHRSDRSSERDVNSASGGSDTASAVPLTLAHLDAYRLDHADAIEDLGLFELLDRGAVAVIEWGDLVAEAFGMTPLVVRISVEESLDPPALDAELDTGFDTNGEFADREPRHITCSAHREGPWHARLVDLKANCAALVAPDAHPETGSHEMNNRCIR
jgi:tRNA A37 threonylcarbamoyladenosine biosynthesis protein TsaE